MWLAASTGSSTRRAVQDARARVSPCFSNFPRRSPRVPSFDPAVAVKKLLRGPKGSLVQLFAALHEPEARAKLVV